MRGFMVAVSPYHAQQNVISVQRQALQMYGVAICLSPVTADFYLDAVLAPQNGRKQRKRFDNVLVFHVFSQR